PDVGGGSTATQDSYNRDGQLTQVVKADGSTVDMAYDSAGRLQTLTTPVGTTTLAYSPTSGLLQTVTAPDNGTLGFGYDGALLTSQTWAGTVAGSVTTAFDNNFQVASEIVNGADAIAFQYDHDGVVVQAGDLALSHDPQNGRLTGTTLGGVTDTLGYD